MLTFRRHPTNHCSFSISYITQAVSIFLCVIDVKAVLQTEQTY